ncbi:acetyltransferase [Apiospora kogelbergensis]|uniref:Acetyltransferase n=1 Tax=Apiospora kogelbergensis TaxID=1337665 RepID=A0AAW0QN25_9PEZI
MSAAMGDPMSAIPKLPLEMRPRQVILRDRQTVASIIPLVSKDQVPLTLLRCLSDRFAKEIDDGDTYPMLEPMSLDDFLSYWFQDFAAIMLLGNIKSPEDMTVKGKDWSKECLGASHIKPNYPGRSSHVCNGGFLLMDASRDLDVDRLLYESYIDWATKLATPTVFNLVYETNVALCTIWDALGFERIDRVKGCGRLKSYPDRLVDTIIYGRELMAEEDAEGPASEDRFDKIKFYLKHAP